MTPGSPTARGTTEILLRVLEEIRERPEQLPRIPVEQFPPGSEERRLLEGFSAMLLRARESEETLRRSQQRFEQLVNTIDGIVWEADAATVEFTFVSKEAEQLLGYPVERWIDEPTFWQDHMHPDDRAWAPAFCAIATAERRPHQFEYRMLAADGRIVWLRDIVTVVVENDRPAKLRGVMIDITEQKAQEQQYRGVFQATNDGLVINSMEGRIVEVNPAFCRMHGYTYEEMLGMNPHDFIHPNSHHLFARFVEEVTAGRAFRARAMDVRKDGTVFHVEVNGSSLMYEGKPHILGVVRDISERVQAYELLEQRVQERTRELSTLLDVSHNVTSELELEPLLNQILEQVRAVVAYSSAAVTVVEGEEVLVRQMISTTPAGGRQTAGRRYRLRQLGPVWEILVRREPIIIPDVRGRDALAEAYRAGLSRMLSMTTDEIEALLYGEHNDVRSWLALPIVQKERVIGMLSFSHPEIGYYSEQHSRLLMAVANQAAIAIENARLYEEAQETARATSAQAQIASRVALGGELKETIDDICRHMTAATGAIAATVALLNPGSDETRIISTYGQPEGYIDALNAVLTSGGRLLVQDAFAGREPHVVEDLRRKVLDTSAYAPLHPYMPLVSWDTTITVPMIYREKPVGVLVCYYPPGRKISPKELGFQTSVADQAAVAVENARLLAEVQQKAALEQRQHLARELHDSVSQALFTINLTARSVEIMLKQEGGVSERVDAALGDLRQLTAAAMAEMRALIFELRPGALEQEGLLAALRKHSAAVQGRERLQIDLVCPGESKLPRLKPEAEEGLYRIAQEALHNVVKHARATRVEVAIGVDANDPRYVSLRVTDNGAGFDVTRVPAGHMGLGTMGQRAAALGADYEVRSAPGAGTSVLVRVPLDRWALAE